MKIFLSIFGTITIGATPILTVVSCAKPETNLIDLNKVIWVTDLGDVKIPESLGMHMEELESILLAKLKELNPELDTNAIRLDLDLFNIRINDHNRTNIRLIEVNGRKKYKFSENTIGFNFTWKAVQPQSLKKLIYGNDSYDFGKVYPIEGNYEIFSNLFDRLNLYVPTYIKETEITWINDGNNKSVIISPKPGTIYFYDTITVRWTEYVEDFYMDYKNPNKYDEDQLTFELDYVLSHKIGAVEPTQLQSQINWYLMLGQRDEAIELIKKSYLFYVKYLAISIILWEKELYSGYNTGTHKRYYTPTTFWDKKSINNSFRRYLPTIDKELEWLSETELFNEIEIEQKDNYIDYIYKVRDFSNEIINKWYLENKDK